MAAENPYGVAQPPPVPRRVDMPNYSPFAAPGVFEAGRAAEQSAINAINDRHQSLYSGESMRKRNEVETALHGGIMAATPYMNQSTILDAQTGGLKSLANYGAYGGTEANLDAGVSRAPMQKVGEQYYFNGQPLATPGVDNGDLTPGARATFSTLGGGYSYNVPPPPTLPFDPNGGAAAPGLAPTAAGPDLPAVAPAESAEGRLNPTGVPRPAGPAVPRQATDMVGTAFTRLEMAQEELRRARETSPYLPHPFLEQELRDAQLNYNNTEKLQESRTKADNPYGVAPAAPKPAAAGNLAPPPGMPAHAIPHYNNVANAYAKYAPGGPGGSQAPLIIAAMESGFVGRPNDAGASSAQGFAQITTPTWLGLTKKLPALKGKSETELLALRNNPGVQAMAERQLRADNYALATSKYKGQFDPNHPLNLYAMHHFNPDAGAMIAAAFKKNKNQYLPDVMGSHWSSAVAANPYLVNKKTGIPLTVGELYSTWINRARGFGYFNANGAA